MSPKRWDPGAPGASPEELRALERGHPMHEPEQEAVRDLDQPLAHGATYSVLGLEVVYRGEEYGIAGAAHGKLHRFSGPEDRVELVSDLFLAELRVSGLLRVVEGR